MNPTVITNDVRVHHLALVRELAHFKDGEHLGQLLQSVSPDLVIEGAMTHDAPAARLAAEAHGIPYLATELGFFPHYSTRSFDPLGHAWNSSLCSQTFQPGDYPEAVKFRKQWLKFPKRPLPASVKKPYYLWCVQLLRDRMNKFDLNLDTWKPLIAHFRSILPDNIQLVVKDHPNQDSVDIPDLTGLPNTIRVQGDLKSLVHGAKAVVGCNSTVLLEAAALFKKPAFAYGRSWWTGHPDLIAPVNTTMTELPDLKYRSSYADWFLTELLKRQATDYDAAIQHFFTARH